MESSTVVMQGRSLSMLIALIRIFILFFVVVEITCPPVPPSEHLHISSSDNHVGAAVNFSCDPGYTVSQRFITCGPTGFWSYSPIICKAGLLVC